MKRKPYFIAPLLCFLLAVSLFAAGTLPLSELSAERYMQHVSFLASDDLKGRGNGTPELERAAEYIAAQFRSYGLKTAGDNGTFFQKFEITTGARVRIEERPPGRRRFQSRRAKTSSRCRSRRPAPMKARLCLRATA